MNIVEETKEYRESADKGALATDEETFQKLVMHYGLTIPEALEEIKKDESWIDIEIYSQAFKAMLTRYMKGFVE